MAIARALVAVRFADRKRARLVSESSQRANQAMADRAPTPVRPMVDFRAEKHLIAPIEAAAATQVDRPSNAEMIRRFLSRPAASVATPLGGQGAVCPGPLRLRGQ